MKECTKGTHTYIHNKQRHIAFIIEDRRKESEEAHLAGAI
jgi:hypothetical protein